MSIKKMYRNFDRYNVFSECGLYSLQETIIQQTKPERVEEIINDPYSFLATTSISRGQADLLTFITDSDPMIMNHLAKCNGAYLQYVVNPTDEIIRIALERFPNALGYLSEKPADDLVSKAFLNKPDSFRNYGRKEGVDKTKWISDELFLQAVDGGMFDLKDNNEYFERNNHSTILLDMKLTPEQQIATINRNPNNVWYFMQMGKNLSAAVQNTIAPLYGQLGKHTKQEIRENFIKWGPALRKAILAHNPWDMRKYMSKITDEELDFGKEALIKRHAGQTFDEMCKDYNDGGVYISVPLFALEESEQIRVIETASKQLAQYSFMFLPEHLQVFCVLNGKKFQTKKNRGWWKRA